MRPFITASSLACALSVVGLANAQEAPATTTATPSQMTTSTTTGSPPMATVPVTTTAPVTTTPVTTTGVTTTSAIVPATPQGSLDLPAPETTTSPVNRPLLITSFLLLGGTYGASAIDAATSSKGADHDNLYYPVVGPWMDYANRGGCPATGSCAGETGNKILLILDGVGQGLGALGMVTSLFIPEKSTRNWYLIGNSGVHAAPARVGTGYGLGAGGVF